VEPQGHVNHFSGRCIHGVAGARQTHEGMRAPDCPACNPGACTCDPEAYEQGPEGQRRYFEDRYCPIHGETRPRVLPRPPL